MIRSSVTISLIPQAKGGPFIFWGELIEHVRQAAQLGFDAVEIFAPDPNSLDRAELKRALRETKLRVAGFGTGGGWILHGLTLTNADAAIRRRAIEFISAMSDLAAEFDAPVIVGSLQGRFGGDVTREQALIWLREGLQEVSEHAKGRGQRLLFEPINRYETNLINRLEDGLDLIKSLGNVRLLADLFHMNIEEESVAGALKSAGGRIGHIHFVDTNRRPAGNGHLNLPEISQTLRGIGYDGFLSAEALPWPDSSRAAEQTMETFRRFFRPLEPKTR